MQTQITFENINCEKMFNETGIPESEIFEAFNGETNDSFYEKSPPSLLSMTSTISPRKEDSKKSIQQKMQERKGELKEYLGSLESAQEVYDYINENALSAAERIPFYEKLSSFIVSELQSTTELSEIRDLLNVCLNESPEKNTVRQKYNKTLASFLKNADLDELLSEYAEISGSLTEESKIILGRAIEICSDIDDCDRVDENISNGSQEDYFLTQKRINLEKEEILACEDSDELKNLYSNAEGGSENEKLATERLISLFDDFQDLKDELADYFSKDSYGFKKTIEKMLTISSSLEEANEVIELCDNGSEEKFNAKKHFKEIFTKEIKNVDIDRLDEMIEFVSDDTEEYYQILEKKASLLEDVDELRDFMENTTQERSVAHQIASAKVKKHYEETIKNSNSFDETIDIMENELDGGDRDFWEKALVKLRSQTFSQEKLEIVLEKAGEFSYISYLVSKDLQKFGEKEELPEKQNETLNENISGEILTEPTENSEYIEKCVTARKKIYRATTPNEVREAYNISPDGSEEQKLAFEKINQFVKGQLDLQLSLTELKKLYEVTLPQTEVRFAVIKKIAELYKKKWLGIF